MMPHVYQIVRNQIAQTDRLVRPDHTYNCQLLLRYQTDDVRQVAVVKPPQIDQLQPGTFRVSLRTDPVLLLICRECKLFDLLPGALLREASGSSILRSDSEAASTTLSNSPATSVAITSPLNTSMGGSAATSNQWLSQVKNAVETTA